MGAELVARFDSYVEPNPTLGEPPVTITHGDMRLDNMLFLTSRGAPVWSTGRPSASARR